MRCLAPGEHDPGDERAERDARDRDQGAAPAVEPARERDGQGRRARRSDLDPGRVDAGAERGPLLEVLLDRDRGDRVAEPHPDPDGPREEHDEPGRRHRRPEHAEDADQRESDRHRPARPDPRGEVGGDRREQPHAENRDRAEQADDRVRGAEGVLDRRDQRADANDLGAQRQRGEKERDERRGGAVRQASGINDVRSRSSSSGSAFPRTSS